MQLQVVTPQGAKVDAKIEQVTAPGVLGEMSILAGHLPLMTGLGIGLLQYKDSAGSHHLAVSGGYLEVADDVVIVVSETAEAPEEIDLARAEISRKKAEKAIGDAEDGGEDWQIAVDKLARAENRIAAGKLTKAPVPV
ncbi:MAG: ATP synthase F1 subunit epsilon [Deltaproteobacteria bacterium]|nr:ATP synthase F1 subunit epsilon [Deltaproteobacteria bacterium]